MIPMGHRKRGRYGQKKECQDFFHLEENCFCVCPRDMQNNSVTYSLEISCFLVETDLVFLVLYGMFFGIFKEEFDGQ